MLFTGFQELTLPVLGFGTMRLPVVGGDDRVIDEAAVRDMVAYAMEQGVNYFDTAWGYHGGHSETVMGKVLSDYPRESFILASKFPGYDLSNMDKAESIFEEQLKKCRVDHFDLYMIHNVCEMNIEQYLDKNYGIKDYFVKQKKAGRIKHLGFSAHGSTEVMERFLDVYGEDMEFCQIQINYLDWTFQNAKGKMELLGRHGLPVWAMEPLRGGRLASLPEDCAAKLKALRPGEGIPAWAIRFLLTIPNIKVVLSGMSNMAQLKDNIATCQEEKLLTGEEMDVLLEVAREMVGQIALPCTACNYCASHCPAELPIPQLLSLYNEHCFTTKGGQAAFIAPMVLGSMAQDKRPAACTGCQSCEAVCPQNIQIAAAMADFAAKTR